MNTIIPGSSIQSIYGAQGTGGAAKANGGAASSPFTTMFTDAMQTMQELNAVKAEDAYNVAMGDIDDLGQIKVNMEKAETAFRLFLEMRNKVLDSYTEIMRMSI